MSASAPYDLLVIGGGINGAGIARDAAGRGLRVLLVEQGDLASATSSASSKLAHGGLRYLESLELRLVAEALAERETLMRIAPHLVWPLTFVLPHDPGLRPAWKLRLGLLLYDRLAARSRLPASRAIRLGRDLPGHPLAHGLDRAFTYADGWLDDSRLVVLNAVDARERGADVRTRCRLLAARPAGALWEARLEPEGGATQTVAARIIVNAAGPWADAVLATLVEQGASRRLRLVRGSHIVVRRVHAGPHAFILQNDDGRVVFLLPFEDDFTLIGTTDVDHTDPARVEVAPDEVDYLLAAANRYLARPLARDDVVWSYAGVRALVDDGEARAAAVTREYTLDLRGGAEGLPPVLTVYGGKLTTYRRLAERAIERLAPLLPGSGPPWTAGTPLPGGDMPASDTAAYLADLSRRHPGIPAALARRLVRSYGTRAERILEAGSRSGERWPDGAAELSAAEIGYLVDVELARSADDIVWRRSKLGLRMSPAQRQQLEARLARGAGQAAGRLRLPD